MLFYLASVLDIARLTASVWVPVPSHKEAKPHDDRGVTADLEAVLGLPMFGQPIVTLGDGRDVLLGLYEATVVWDDHPREVQVLATDGGAVIGRSLLYYGYRVTMDVVDGGLVTIEAKTS